MAMTDTQGKSPGRAALFDELDMFAEYGAAIHYRELTEVSEALMASYARLIRDGIPCELVAFAMLGATINLYDMFEKRAGLPELLREMAIRIEQKTACEPN